METPSGFVSNAHPYGMQKRMLNSLFSYVNNPKHKSSFGFDRERAGFVHIFSTCDRNSNKE